MGNDPRQLRIDTKQAIFKMLEGREMPTIDLSNALSAINNFRPETNLKIIQEMKGAFQIEVLEGVARMPQKRRL